MNEAQKRFGEPKDAVREKVQGFLSSMVQDFIRQAPFAVLATSNAAGDCDASPKGGAPGFVKVLDERRLIVPDIAGNRLFQSYENLETNPKVALVFLMPGCEWTVRVNGRARVVASDEELEGAEAAVLWSDDNTKVLQGVLVEVDEAFAHCPRAFLFSKLWDVERIQKTAEQEPNAYWFKRWRESMEAAAG